MPDLKDKFEKELELCDWSMLAPHYARGVLLLVKPEIELITVAIALAEDNAQVVKQWQTSEYLRPPSDEEVTSWNKMSGEKFAKFLIVQPFVLIQKIES